MHHISFLFCRGTRLSYSKDGKLSPALRRATGRQGHNGMSHFRPMGTVYRGTKFRSRVEARWACFFDTLGVEWVYEFQHYDFGVKAVWDDDEFREYLNEALYENDWDDREDVIRDAYRHRYERRMYLPDFWLPTFNHWVEIKGKSPTYEEQMKASHLARKSGKPVTIL